MPGFEPIGIILVFVGVFVIVLGLIFLFWGRARHLGRLPGDVSVKRGNIGCYFPIVTSLLISLALTIIINLVLWLFRC